MPNNIFARVFNPEKGIFVTDELQLTDNDMNAEGFTKYLQLKVMAL